ncbi:MAG TPA: hypothetical protein VGF67_32230 [Ktedonobacteraceae bacterium]|jgi:hypothetical protein
MLDIEGDDFPEARDLVLEGVDGASKHVREQSSIKLVELLAEPKAGGQGLLDIEAMRVAGSEDEVKARFDHKQRVFDEKGAQLGRGEEALTDTDEEGFEVGRFGMSGPASERLLALPSLDDGPIEGGEKGAVVFDHVIMFEHGGDGRLVKNARGRYHSEGLLLWVGCC